MRTEMSAGVPPRPSSMRMPSGVVNSTDDAGDLGQRAAHLRLQLLARRGRRSGRSTTSTSESVCGIGSSVRSARPVRRTTSSTSGNLRSTSSTRWLRRSTSSSEASAGSTVCSSRAPSSIWGMKSVPMAKASAMAGTVSASVASADQPGAAQAPGQQRAGRRP